MLCPVRHSASVLDLLCFGSTIRSLLLIAYHSPALPGPERDLLPFFSHPQGPQTHEACRSASSVAHVKTLDHGIVPVDNSGRDVNHQDLWEPSPRGQDQCPHFPIAVIGKNTSSKFDLSIRST
jgi:hypothetical protein